MKLRALFLPDASGYFEAEHAEIVADDTVDVETDLRVNRRVAARRQRRRSNVELHVLGEHAAAFHANVPSVVASKGRRCERGRC
jgi:hypothetical protein